MDKSGKPLENLVAFVEGLLLPKGFEVAQNERVLNDEGELIAEFDIEIRGKLGSTQIHWLIECRDRPSAGPAPSSWIEQLIGRKQRFNLSRVTAVSTTGFAAPAVELAKQFGIELREVRSLAPDEFSDWLKFTSFEVVERKQNLVHAKVGAIDQITPEQFEALKSTIASSTAETPILRSIVSGETTSLLGAFTGVMSQNLQLYDQIRLNAPPQRVTLCVRYSTPNDYFELVTPTGPIRIIEIRFTAEFSVESKVAELESAVEYAILDSGEAISKAATFPFEAIGKKMSLEIHRVSESNESHIAIRIDGELDA